MVLQVYAVPSLPPHCNLLIRFLACAHPTGTCFDNYTILPILRPERPNKPCLTCTKQWCLDAKLEMCTNATLGDSNPDTATGHEGDVSALCFRAFRNLQDLRSC